MIVLCLLVTMTSPFAAATQTAYVEQDAERLQSLLERAESREDSLLVRYRLYPLTEDEAVLKEIPATLSAGTAREYALLSGLWAYRAGEASFLAALRYGQRSTDLLDAATSRAPEAPFVLLVEGQSLLFRPAIAGRDPAAAAERFARLTSITEDDNVAGISKQEAQVWQWLALTEAERSKMANALRTRLQKQTLPPLLQQFLEDPPEA